MPWTHRSFWIALLVMSILSVNPAALSAEATEPAVIVNSGSTNIAGFRIVVERSGDAEYTASPGRFGPQSQEKPKPVRRKLPAALAEGFFSDLERGKPLSSLPQPRCMKSASFGVNLTVKLGDEKTPDLSCGDGGNAVLQALIRDVNEVVTLFAAK